MRASKSDFLLGNPIFSGARVALKLGNQLLLYITVEDFALYGPRIVRRCLGWNLVRKSDFRTADFSEHPKAVRIQDTFCDLNPLKIEILHVLGLLGTAFQ